MKKIAILQIILLSTFVFSQSKYVNYQTFEELVQEVKPHREKHLLTLDEFNLKSKEVNTIILDTRSDKMYNLKHIKGAIHLDFTDFTQYALDSIMNKYAGKETKILIYCNNNFFDSKSNLVIGNQPFQDNAFISKTSYDENEIKEKTKNITLALNIPTYINLYGYGYKNVFELNELVDVNDKRIEFEGSYKNNEFKILQ